MYVDALAVAGVHPPSCRNSNGPRDLRVDQQISMNSKSLTFPHEGTEQFEFSTEIHQLCKGISNICLGIFLTNSDDPGSYCLSYNVVVDCIVLFSQHRFRNTSVLDHCHIVAEHAAWSNNRYPEAFNLDA